MSITNKHEIIMLKAAVDAVSSGRCWTTSLRFKCEDCLQEITVDPCPDPDGELPIFYVDPCSNPDCPSNKVA